MFDALNVAVLNVLEKGIFVVKSVLLKEKKFLKVFMFIWRSASISLFLLDGI